MTATIQVTIDCRDPHVLADWWAETLGWAVEAQDPVFIQRMIDQGHATEEDTRIYRGGLVWRSGAAIHADPIDTPGCPRIFFQAVPEPKSTKNRVHLDVRPATDEDIEAVRSRLVERGATVISTGRQGPHTWTTMADPEGNEFCV